MASVDTSNGHAGQHIEVTTLGTHIAVRSMHELTNRSEPIDRTIDVGEENHCVPLYGYLADALMRDVLDRRSAGKDLLDAARSNNLAITDEMRRGAHIVIADDVVDECVGQLLEHSHSFDGDEHFNNAAALLSRSDAVELSRNRISGAYDEILRQGDTVDWRSLEEQPVVTCVETQMRNAVIATIASVNKKHDGVLGDELALTSLLMADSGLRCILTLQPNLSEEAARELVASGGNNFDQIAGTGHQWRCLLQCRERVLGLLKDTSGVSNVHVGRALRNLHESNEVRIDLEGMLSDARELVWMLQEDARLHPPSVH